jgi:amidase
MTINKPLLVNIPVPVPQGTADFEKKRTAILDNLARSVPPQYRIACNYITEPRRDVTSIPRECGVLDDVDLEITEQYDMTSLAAAIAVKKYTAVQVTTAFLKRSIVAHQLSCCLTQWSPEAALQRAQELDEFLAREGKTVGPFHGVPISLKQHIPLANSWSDIGYLSTRHYDASDSALVSLLRKLGAVFYCKTNRKYLRRTS